MPRLLQDLIGTQARERADATAIVCGPTRWSYAELDRVSNQIACVLRESGCRQGEPIAVLMPASVMAIAALLGVYKADGVAVPIDPTSPAVRLRRMLRTCEITRMLAAGTVGHLARDLATDPEVGRLAIGWLDTEAPEDLPVEFRLGDLAVYSGEPIDRRNRSFHPAHVVFTPAAVPKGVILTHGNVIERAVWLAQYFGLTPADRVSGHPSLHVGMSLLDLFMAASAGAELHLVPLMSSVLPKSLGGFIRSSAITHWSSVAPVLSYVAQFDALAPGCFPALKRVACAGAPCPTDTLHYWMRSLPHVSFVHLYGYPETAMVNGISTVAASTSDAPLPIGTVCAGDELLVLDASMQRVPRGTIGELFVAGAALTRGYWGDLTQTNAAFVRRPDRPQERMYRTGDLARVDDRGMVSVEGRRDTQIARGGRMETGELAFAVHAVGSVQDAAVAAFDRPGDHGARRPVL